MARSASFRQERSSSLIPMRDRISHQSFREPGVSQLHPHATVPVARPGSSSSYQSYSKSVYSKYANHETEYWRTSFASTRPQTEGASSSEKSRSTRSNHPTLPNEESISHEVSKAQRAPVISKCRFCSRGVEKGRLLSVCKCNNHNRFAHEICLMKEIRKRPHARCKTCVHRLTLQRMERPSFLEMSRTFRSDRPTSTNKKSILPGVHSATRPPTRLRRCRFCTHDRDQETLVRVCKCNNEARLAHIRCLENAVRTRSVTRCLLCDHRLTIMGKGDVVISVEEDQEVSENGLHDKVVRTLSNPYVKKTMVFICAVAGIVLFFMGVYFNFRLKSQSRKN